MKKNNSVRFGGIWIAAGMITGIVIPLILRIALGRMIWPLVIAGGIILAVFGVVTILKTRQDAAEGPRHEKTMRETLGYDPEKQVPVIRSSICTGEKTAGFKDKNSGRFTEVMLIRTPKDEERFKEIYHLDSVKTEY